MTVLTSDVARPSDGLPPAVPSEPTLAPSGHPATEAATGSATEAAERSLRRLVIFVVPAWLLALGFAAASPSSGISPRVLVPCLVLVLLTYALFATGRDRRGGLLCGSLFAATIAIAVSGPTGLDVSSYPIVEPALSLALLVTGLLVRGRLGIVWVLSMTCAVVAAVGLQQLLLGSPQPAGGLALIAGNALVSGLGALAVARVLRSTAAASDRAAAAALAATRSRIAAETAGQAEARRVTRVLHDTVINTLGAIGVLPEQDRGLVRERCAADLAAVEALSLPNPDLYDPVAATRERARLCGVKLAVRAEPGPGPLPHPVGEAVAGALGEAVVNVGKHSGTDRAELDFTWDGRVGSATLTDRGIGCSDHPRKRGGTAESVAARCAEAGVAIHIGMTPGGRTRVRLTWTAPERRGTDRAANREAATTRESSATAGEPLAHVMGRVALPVAGVIGSFGVICTLARPNVAAVLGNLTALSLISLVMWWAWRTMRGRGPVTLPLPVYPVWVIAVVILPAVGATGCQRIGQLWWGSLAGVAVIVGVILIDARRSAVVIVIAAYAAGHMFLILDVARTSTSCALDSGALLVLDVCFSLAFLLFRRTLARQWETGLLLRQRMVLLRVAHAEARAREAARETNLARAMTVCRPLLRGIADGDLDPGSPSVRFECGRAAWTLRSLIAMPTEDDVLTPILADLLVTASERRIDLHVIADTLQPLPADRAASVRETLEEFLSGIPDRGSGNVTTLTNGTATVLLASARIRVHRTDHLRHTAESQGWTLDRDAYTITLETSWGGRP